MFIRFVGICLWAYVYDLMFGNKPSFFVAYIEILINAVFVDHVDMRNRKTLQYSNIIKVPPSTYVINKHIQRVFQYLFDAICLFYASTSYEND